MMKNQRKTENVKQNHTNIKKRTKKYKTRKWEDENRLQDEMKVQEKKAQQILW